MNTGYTIDMSGNAYSLKEGEFHREDGPAVIYADGSEHWYVNGLRHREDGPAVIEASGTQHWYQYGKAHRIDGPAVLFPGGRQSWFVNGERVYTWVRFQQLTYVSDEDMTALILKYGDIT